MIEGRNRWKAGTDRGREGQREDGSDCPEGRDQGGTNERNDRGGTGMIDEREEGRKERQRNE